VAVVTSYPVDQTVSQGYYLNNLVTEAEYLMAHGYSATGAAGVAGATAGESGGNPESVGTGGAGLIAWTPPSKASPYQPIVTGDAQTDFNHQLVDILQYNNDQGSANVNNLNRQTDPVQAADDYSTVFERPAVHLSDVRPAVASYVYDAVQGIPTTGSLKTPASAQVSGDGSGTTPAETTSSGSIGWGPFSISYDTIERFGLVVFGGAMILVGIWLLVGKEAAKVTVSTAKTAAKAGEVAAV
jgi:hypothetical protein